MVIRLDIIDVYRARAMTAPATATSPTSLGAKAEAPLAGVEVLGEEAAPETDELAALAALEARDGPDPLEGLAMAEVAEDGP